MVIDQMVIVPYAYGSMRVMVIDQVPGVIMVIDQVPGVVMVIDQAPYTSNGKSRMR